MGIIYPSGFDTFGVPSLPEDTSLSSAGTDTRNHTENHHDLGLAVMALEANAVKKSHDHAGDGTVNHGIKLAQVNTHESVDTDIGVGSLHHSIGTGPTQAAAGNHAHDYAGPSIFNKPLELCTSTTRPFDPMVGKLIWETDTNCMRAWTQFPNNELVSGTTYTYKFDTANAVNSLDSSVFTVTYPTGVSPADGAIGAPSAGNCSWHVGANVTCRAIAQVVKTGKATTVTDDQQLTFITGNTTMQGSGWWFWGPENPSPTNDGYLRMSADGQHYVRYSITDSGCAVAYTTTGPANEIFLGGVKASTNHARTEWTCKAVGGTYIVYANGVQVLAAVDYQNAVSVGANYRGWGIGMTGAADEGGQLHPNNLTQITITDLPYYTSGLLWQLLPVGAVPHLRAESHFTQQVVAGPRGSICGFDTVLWDWPFRHFMTVEVSQTDITIQEPGHYSVHTSISWDWHFHEFDHSHVAITVNGTDIGRRNWLFMRGNGFAPGFPQSHEIHFTYYFARGDVIRVNARHNSPSTCWLWWHDVSPDRQMCWVELDFLSA